MGLFYLLLGCRITAQISMDFLDLFLDSNWMTEMPQKHRLKYLKNTDLNTAKTPIEIPQKCRLNFECH